MKLFFNSLRINNENFKINKRNNYLSLIGVIIGLSGFFLLLSIAIYELSYDRYQKDYKNIYRINQDRVRHNQVFEKVPSIIPGIGEDVYNDFDEVIGYARFADFVSTSVGFGDRIFNGEKIYACDTSGLDFLAAKFIKGNSKNALVGLNKVVISKRIADKVFGSEDPLGKTLMIRSVWNEYPCEITGVVENLPKNTHLDCDVFISLPTYISTWTWNFGIEFWPAFYTFIKVRKNTNIEKLNKKINEYVEKNYQWFFETQPSVKFSLKLEPFANIYLHSEYQASTKKGNYNQVIVAIIFALGIFFTSLICYLNVTNSVIYYLYKENSLKSVFGSKNINALSRIFVENLFFLLVIFIAALLIAFILMNMLNAAFEDIRPIVRNKMLGYFSVIFFAGVILSTLINFQSFYRLKKKGLKEFSEQGRFLPLQKVTIGLQYAIAILCIFCTIIFLKQIKFVFNTNLNMDVDNVFYTQAPMIKGNTRKMVDSLKNILLTYPEIEDISYSRNMVGFEIRNFDYFSSDKNPGEIKKILYLGTDRDYIKTFKIPLIAGTNFSEKEQEHVRIILNREAARQLGYDNVNDIIGQTFKLEHYSEEKVIGVIENYCHEFLNKKILPLALYGGTNYQPKWMSFRIKPGTEKKVLEIIHKEWKKFYPITLLDISCLKDLQKQINIRETQFANLTLWISIIIFILTFFGTYAVSLFDIANNSEMYSIYESSKRLFVVLSKKYYIILAIASIIIIPVSIYCSNLWLSSFSQRVKITWIYPLVSVLLIFILVTIIMIYDTYLIKKSKVASKNNEAG